MQMISHSFSRQSNLPSSGEMQNTGPKKKECHDDLFRGRRLGGGGSGEGWGKEREDPSHC